MTQAPEIGAINRLHFSGAGFWYSLRVSCISCISGTGFVWYQIPTPIRTVFYSKPENGMHVTEMMNYDWSMRTAYILMRFLVI